MKAIVVGGSGALGRVLVKDLKLKGISPINIDFIKNSDADNNIIIKNDIPLRFQLKDIMNNLSTNILIKDNELKGVICSAGGWVGESAKDDNFLDNLHLMHTMNVESAALSSHLSIKYLSTNGLFILTGAHAATQTQPKMLSYGISKISTHYLIKSVAQDKDFIKKNITALSILPVTIDTINNRKFMNENDIKNATKPEEISNKCINFLIDIDSRPISGTLLAVYTINNINTWRTVSLFSE